MIELNLVLLCVLIGLVGVVFATIVSLIPGLHIYSILGFVVLFLLNLDEEVDPMLFSSLTVSMLIGYCLGSCISATFFQTPDDSSIFMVFPSQKYLADGRGYEAVYITALGAVIGAVISCLLIIFAADFLVDFVDLIVEHSLWIIATGMLFVWMSEWPKDPARKKKRWKNLAAAWVQLGMGLVTIIASGILGIYLFFSQLVPPERSFQGLAAAFVGLFAFPSLIQNLFSSKKVPDQYHGKSVELTRSDIVQGTAAGVIGGAIGMMVPSLTAGVGNTFSRHAVAQSGDKSFLFSQGLSRTVYYVGAVLLLFIPGVVIRRGGAALFISMFYLPETRGELLIIAAVVLVASAAGWYIFTLILKGVTKIVHRINTRYVSLIGIIIMLLLTYYMLGLSGLMILVIATFIGAIPLVYNTRRIHCIGVITIPIMLSMAGLTPIVCQIFGIA
ncbi:MAG: hypothetical protein GF364_07375 [Candidatus Lokiarchaeota archaeon]|nr:hypothetical protein [Candidatus Lokiarchaeota archaeon]